MTPQSRFDCNTFETYEDYYLSKYNLEIFGSKEQPLLEVNYTLIIATTFHYQIEHFMFVIYD